MTLNLNQYPSVSCVFFLICLYFNVLSQYTRPRMFISNEKISFLQSKIASETEPYYSYALSVLNQANTWVGKEIPSQQQWSAFSDSTIRIYGNRLPTLCLTYLVSGDNQYMASLKSWMNALSSYPNWAEDVALGASHVLFGMSVALDWCYLGFTAGEKDNYIQKILLQMDLIHTCFVTRNEDCYWAENYIANHNHVILSSVATAAFSLMGEVGMDQSHLNEVSQDVYDDFTLVLENLSPEGSNQEGVPYSTYSLEGLLRGFEVEHRRTGIDRILSSDYFRNFGEFRLHSSIPGYIGVIRFSDADPFDYHGPSFYLFLLASKFNNRLYQWLGEKVDEEVEILGLSIGSVEWRTLIWYNESVGKSDPVTSNVPTFKHFEDLGLIVSRDNWEHSNSSLLSFICGPPAGHSAEENLGFGMGGIAHVHPHAGSFHFYYNSTPLLIEDGYTYWKLTMSHNLVTFGDSFEGQYGEQSKWFSKNQLITEKGTANIEHAIFEEKYDYFVANITKMYPNSLKVQKFHRHLVFALKKYIVVIDEIETGKENFYNFHLHGQHTGRFNVGENGLSFSNSNGVGFEVFDFSMNENVYSAGTYNLTLTLSDRTHVVQSQLLNISTDSKVTNNLFVVIIAPFVENNLEFDGNFNFEKGDFFICNFHELKLGIDINEREVWIVEEDDNDNNDDDSTGETDDDDDEKKKNEKAGVIIGVVFGAVAITVLVLVCIVLLTVFVFYLAKRKRSISEEEEEMNEKI